MEVNLIKLMELIASINYGEAKVMSKCLYVPYISTNLVLGKRTFCVFMISVNGDVRVM